MSEMIDRMVKAMDRAWEQFLHNGCSTGNIREAYARAMLDELREPTPEMYQAGGNIVGDDQSTASAIWRAMIDEAKR